MEKKRPDKLGPWQAHDLELSLARQIKAGLEAVEPRRERWRQTRGQFLCENLPSGATKSWQWRGNANLSQATGDQVTAGVVHDIVSVDPVCVAMPSDPEAKVDVREAGAQWFFQMANGKKSLREVACTSWWSNSGVLRVEYEEGGEDGWPHIDIEQVAPFDFVVYPAFAKTVEEAMLVGRRLERTRGEIKALQEAGTYFAAELSETSVSDDSMDLTGASQPPQHVSVGTEFDKIELWNLSVRDVKNNTWYDCTYERTGEKILRWREEPAKTPPYAVFALCEKADGDGFWSSPSYGNNLQQLQIDFSALWGATIDAAKMNASPTSYGELDSSQAALSGPGENVDMMGASPPAFKPVRYDPAGTAELLSMCIQRAQVVARATVGGIGIRQTGVATATQEEILQSGRDESDDDRILFFSTGVERLWGLIDRLLRVNLEDWFPKFRGQFQPDEGEATLETVMEEYKVPVLWKLAVQSAAGTPRGKMAMVDGLVQAELAANGAGQTLGYDLYALGTDKVELAERLGLPDAEEAQKPRDPQQLVQWVAQNTGIAPELVAAALQDAGQRQQQLQAEQQQLQQLQAQGMGGAPVDAGAPAGNGGRSMALPSLNGQVPAGTSTGLPGQSPGKPPN